MKNEVNISSSLELKKRIMELNNQKYEQEEEIKKEFKELRYSLTPGSLIREAISGTTEEINETPDLKHDLVQRALNVGMAYAIGRLFGRSTSIRGFVTSIIAERVAQYVVNNNTDQIIAGISTLVETVKKNRRQVEDPEAEQAY